MKKWMVCTLVFLVLVCAAITVVADEYPVNPNQNRLWQLEAISKKERESSDLKKATNGPVTITCIKQPTLGGTGIWSIQIKSNYSYNDITCRISMKDYSSDYSTVYAKDYDRNPGYFYTCSIVSGGDYEVSVWVGQKGGVGYLARETFHINDDASHISLTEKVSQVVSSCKASTQWQTALNMYDWLTTHVYYDHNLEYYGADMILRGYGVCDGYSRAYMMMCKAAGIPVGRVTNYNHAWNAIKLDGQWYYVDATWDDPGKEKVLKSGNEGHAFFCITKEILFLDHPTKEFQQDSIIGACTSLDMNYFVYTGNWENFKLRNNSSAPTILGDIYQSIEAGKVTYTVDDGSYIYYPDFGKTRWDSSLRMKRILGWGLKKKMFSLTNGGPIKIQVTESPVKTSFLGWNITETGTLKLPLPTGSNPKVPARAFRGIGATTVQIPNGYKQINSDAFAGSKVRTVYIPASVTYIDPNAFRNCGRILFITTNSTAKNYATEHGFLVLSQ